MENLPKDVIVEMALNLLPVDVVNFCIVSKLQNKFCNSNDFWRRKLEKDYAEEVFHSYVTEIPIENPKQIYINRFTFVSKKIEAFIPNFISDFFHEDFKNFLTQEYNNKLYSNLYDIYENMKNYKNEDDIDMNDMIVIKLRPFVPHNAAYEDLVTSIRPLIENLIEIESVDLINREMTKKLKRDLKIKIK